MSHLSSLQQTASQAAAEELSPLEELRLPERLGRLRARLIRIALALVLGSIAAFSWSGWLLDQLQANHPSLTQLVLLSPSEGFMARVKLAVAGGAIVALPVAMIEAWAATTARLGRWRRFKLFFLIPLSLALFCGGVLFAVRVLLPFALRFFLAFGAGQVEAMISAGSYVNFVIYLALPIGIIFELPVVVLFLARIDVLRPGTLIERRRFAWLGAFVLGAILTPADVFSMILVAIPLILLYEMSVVITRLAVPRR